MGFGPWKGAGHTPRGATSRYTGPIKPDTRTMGSTGIGSPGKSSEFKNTSRPVDPGDAPAGTPDYGTESGPGILEQWFNQRASGTDPAYQYSLSRGMDAIDDRMAAAGGFNSGARGQQLSDFGANMGAQRMAQIDALAGGASGEHMGRLNAMFNQGLGLASGQAGTMGAYDIANNQGTIDLQKAILEMMGGKAGVDDRSTQRGLNNIMGMGGVIGSIWGGGGGGGGMPVGGGGGNTNPYKV